MGSGGGLVTSLQQHGCGEQGRPPRRQVRGTVRLCNHIAEIADYLGDIGIGSVRACEQIPEDDSAMGIRNLGRGWVTRRHDPIARPPSDHRHPCVRKVDHISIMDALEIAANDPSARSLRQFGANSLPVIPHNRC